MEKGCIEFHVCLSVMSIALFISVCLNILLYALRRKDRQKREAGEALYQDSFQSDRFEDEERLNQDNPIYGNIFVDGGVPKYGDYEQMKKTCAKQDEKSDPEDVSYASLDLKLVRKHKKKKKYQEKHNQHTVQTHPPLLAMTRRMDMETDCDITLPSLTSNLIVSRSSIYLNSHQVALETEELQRQRESEGDRETERNSNQE